MRDGPGDLTIVGRLLSTSDVWSDDVEASDERLRGVDVEGDL